MDFSKQEKRALRELTGLAHQRELARELEKLEKYFAAWREGAIDVFELDERIHQFHSGPHKKLFVFYTQAANPPLNVARALASGLIAESEVPQDLFEKLKLRPSAKDKIASVYVDSELGSEAVTYVLESGKEDSVHGDAFLDYNRDPDFLREVTLHNLTVDAVKLVKKSGLSKHELVRRLRTSPSQLYRLLDPANYKKSMDEMLRLLAVLVKTKNGGRWQAVTIRKIMAG